jgi:hypothetical protein
MPELLLGMTDTIAFPLWAAAAAAAVMALLAIVAMFRIGSRQVLGLVVAAVAMLGIGWIVAERLDSNSKAEQRRAIEARVASLAAQALAPNSMLACLDAAGGTLVHEACERALFASPEQVAASLNYVGARLDLLREIAMVAAIDDTAYDSLRTPILRSLEADRFGLVAQVLVARDGCSLAACYAFDLLPQNRQVVSNMSERAYDMRVARFAAIWNDKPGGPALAAQAPPSMPQPSQMPTNANFPSASSIPPVSIMSNEPGRPGQNGVEAPPRAESAKSEPVKPDRPQAAPPPRRPAQKAQAPKREPQPAQQPSAPADPFPPPVGGSQTTGAQPQ